MVLGWFLEVWQHVKSMKPAFLSRKPHFSFITVHYFWIIGMTILGSVIIFPQRNMDYIDALFFASGASTQSGLNTIDLNLLKTYQQVVIFFISMMTNPIAINTFVVFLRLYWFEKRFQHIAREAKRNRRSISKSRSQTKGERDIEREELGVGGRVITVLHHTTRANGMTDGRSKADSEAIHTGHMEVLKEQPEDPESNSSGESSKSGRESSSANEPLKQLPRTGTGTQIKFAAQVKRSDGMDDEILRIPDQRPDEDHIAFLERQRNLSDTEVLRIPGPRDADRGVAPETMDEDMIRENLLRRDSTLEQSQSESGVVRVESLERVATDEERPRRRNITIAEPSRTAGEKVTTDARSAFRTLGVLRPRKPRVVKDEKVHEDSNHISAVSRVKSFSTLKKALSREKIEDNPYLSWQPTIGRNSAFVDLTEEQREELGGIEYRSLKSLALILVCYYWGFTFLGIVSLVPWINGSDYFGAVVDGVGQSRTWWGFFTSMSSFTDLGFTLTPDSMISFQQAVWPLLLMSFLIIIGNTGFPIMLRWVIWVTSQYVPKGSGIWEELRFLLDHPRRCFTLLFPGKATWWLFGILVLLNGVDLIFFIILDLGNTVVTQLPVNIRVLDGWFQAVSTRTAGFACVNLADLHPGIQVSYLIMMYISVLPIAISVRRTNVYEEKSLGIWGSPGEENEDEGEPSYVGAHLRRQLSFDLWFIFLGFFIISISEGERLQNDVNFTMFNVLFEIVSAYGTVGLSLGYTGINASFSAEFGVIAKLVIIAMQIRGRHRGLPYELDRAILLPSESLAEKEHKDAVARHRRGSNATFTGNPFGQVNSAGGDSARGKQHKDRSQNILSSMLHPGPTIPNSHRFHHRESLDRENDHIGGMHRAATHMDRPQSRGRAFSLFGPLQKRMSV